VSPKFMTNTFYNIVLSWWSWRHRDAIYHN